MAVRPAGFAHVRGTGAWFSASPRVQRLAAAHIVVLLAVAMGAVALHQRPGTPVEPLALAAATGPASGPVVVANPPRLAAAGVAAPRRPAKTPPKVQRAPRVQRAHPPAPSSGWAYWSARIRGCESHGDPHAPADYKAQNPHSTASGAYQITDATWGGQYGVTHASDASPAQQDAVAAALYRRHGTADWAASAACWRTH